jgi:hypothetical protein
MGLSLLPPAEMSGAGDIFLDAMDECDIKKDIACYL